MVATTLPTVILVVTNTVMTTIQRFSNDVLLMVLKYITTRSSALSTPSIGLCPYSFAGFRNYRSRLCPYSHCVRFSSVVLFVSTNVDTLCVSGVSPIELLWRLHVLLPLHLINGVRLESIFASASSGFPDFFFYISPLLASLPTNLLPF